MCQLMEKCLNLDLELMSFQLMEGGGIIRCMIDDSSTTLLFSRMFVSKCCICLIMFLANERVMGGGSLPKTLSSSYLLTMVVLVLDLGASILCKKEKRKKRKRKKREKVFSDIFN